MLPVNIGASFSFFVVCVNRYNFIVYIIFYSGINMTAKFEWLVAGLGNPGDKYAYNRHNIGWMVAASICRKYNKPVMAWNNLCYKSTLRIEGKLALVSLPTTYMYNSGEAIEFLTHQYNIPSERVVVVTDEYNFPLGRVHLRRGGSDGGHNGVASVIEKLDTSDFYRLRCGIGNDFPPGGLVDYVLSNFKKEEKAGRDRMIARAVESIEHMVRLGPDRAMSDINSGRLWQDEQPTESAVKNGSGKSVSKIISEVKHKLFR
jgi:PTH1 family peptidyl-tRNA hydrolase